MTPSANSCRRAGDSGLTSEAFDFTILQANKPLESKDLAAGSRKLLLTRVAGGRGTGPLLVVTIAPFALLPAPTLLLIAAEARSWLGLIIRAALSA